MWHAFTRPLPGKVLLLPAFFLPVSHLSPRCLLGRLSKRQMSSAFRRRHNQAGSELSSVPEESGRQPCFGCCFFRFTLWVYGFSKPIHYIPIPFSLDRRLTSSVISTYLLLHLFVAGQGNGESTRRTVTDGRACSLFFSGLHQAKRQRSARHHRQLVALCV